MHMALLLAMTMFPAAAGDGAVPVEQEPLHKTIFRNEYVQAFRVRLEPGAKTLMHTHAHDDAAVRLSSATVANERPGEAVSAGEAVVPGMVSCRTNEPIAYTHAVHNVGSSLFDVIDVQVLRRPAGEDAPPAGPPAVENPKMRVYRYELAPGQASSQHAHRRPYVMVAATDMTLRMTSPDGQAMEHAVKAGDLHWIDTPVTHTLVNAGSTNGVIVEFELK